MEHTTNVIELKQLHQCGKGCAPTTRCNSTLNRFCHSLQNPSNALRFRQAPEKYCREFTLEQPALEAITDLDVRRLLDLGASLSCLDHLTAVFELNAVELGAQQGSMSEQEFLRATIEGPDNTDPT